MGARKKQQEFKIEGFEKPKDWFGGKTGHGKYKRPLDSKFPTHLILRSDNAKGDFSFRHPRHFAKVNALVRKCAEKYGIKIHEYANVGNHLHLLLHFKLRQQWIRFIRELCSRLAFLVLEREGRKKMKWKFWTSKPFTRIVRGWGRAYRVMRDYVTLNQLEGEGLISRMDRRKTRMSTA